MSFVVKDNQIQESDGEDDFDVELDNPNTFFGSHINLIPLHSSVQGPRLFYGARFYNQALPLQTPEAPLVQNLIHGDPDGKSFDQKYGSSAGALFSEDDAEVDDVTEDFISLKMPDGSKRQVDMYNNFPFNRKSVSGDTEVFIRRGVEVTRMCIEDYEFVPGDEVMSYDTDTCASAWCPIGNIVAHDCDKLMYRVMFQSGRYVDVTEDHSLLTMNSDWQLAPILPYECIEGQTSSPVVFGSLPVNDSWTLEHGVIDGLYLNHSCLLTYSREIKRRLVSDFGPVQGTKRLPADVYSRGPEYLKGLICGFMRVEGHMWSGQNKHVQLTAATESKDLRDHMVTVLQMLGVFATKFTAPLKSSKESYGFRVIPQHINKLDRWFYNDDMNDKLIAATQVSGDSPYEHIPVYDYNARRYLYDSIEGNPDSITYKKSELGRIPKSVIKDYSGRPGAWARGDVLWDTIISITPIDSPDRVYDFEVPGPQAFATADGILVHNTLWHNTSKVAKGDKVTKGQLLAKSNYTDDEGTLAMGVNAKVGLTPYKGWSLDDAIVISEAFAKRLTSEHAYTEEQDFDRDTKGGQNHFVSLFPDKFTKKQRDTLDAQGVVMPGTVLQKGDPMILATKPKVISSSTSQLGKLSNITRSARSDSSTVWEHDTPGLVQDVGITKNGVKVIAKTYAPAEKGDKIVFRSGQKGIISKVMAPEQMPRTVGGEPLEVLLNPLGIPSRVNNSMIYELILGKLARKKGHALKLPSFNKPGEAWYKQVMDMMEEEGVSDLEEIFDPETGKKLENPVTVGEAYVLKLHHTASSKSNARGNASYDSDEQPSQGGSASAQAKRLSGLEVHSMLSAGAYHNLRESATLRGQRNDEYWRQLRMGYTPREPGEPFVWKKFQALLGGSGLKVQDIGKGKMRIRPMTDTDLDKEKPIEVTDGRTVNLNTLEPFKGGLFDHALVGSNKWGKISLKERMPNPAFESQIRQLLGLTEKQLRSILAGEEDIPEHLI